jgi:uncharacterized oligopeptide transporter (OPT) family protein
MNSHEPEEGHASERSLLLARKINTSTSRTRLTLRGVVLGLIMGTIICPTNLYFGLQTGHVTGFPMAVAAISKGVCEALRMKESLRIEENAVVVAVSTTVGDMPMVAALVGVIPALEYLMEPEDGGPLDLSFFQLLGWALGLCFFGPLLAMKLRELFVVHLKLPFPWAQATVSVLRECHDVGVSTAPTDQPSEGDTNLETGVNGSVHEPGHSVTSITRMRCGMVVFLASASISGFWVRSNLPENCSS